MTDGTNGTDGTDGTNVTNVTNVTISAGTRLGPYELLAPLGAGGMGEVWIAHDLRLHRRVAVKLLHADLSSDGDRLARFEREARTAAALSHPNIVALHDVGDWQGRPWIVTELLDGETLRGRLGRGALPLREALAVAAEAAYGLAAAHARGIVHRDVKPENLFLCRDGLVKILDFGLARLEAVPTGSEEAGGSVTSTGFVVGTPGYMSPEQARGDAVDARSDLFSLGAVLYEALTGARAFQRPSAVETMRAVLREPAPPPSDLVPSLPEGVDAVVAHALEKQPEERFQTARDLAFALESLARLQLPPREAHPPAAGRGRRLGAAGATAALVLLLLAGAFREGERRGSAGPTFRQLTFRHGTVVSARFASGGSSVVYTAAWEGHGPEVFSEPVGEPVARSLGVPGGIVTAVHGAEVALLTGLPPGPALGIVGRAQERGGTLVRLPLAGGTPREVLEDVFDADWAPDGDAFCVVRRGAGVDRLEYPPGRRLHEGAGYLESPRISPDGRSVAFLEHPSPTDNAGSVSLVDGEGTHRVLSSGWKGELTGLAWDPSGRRLFFTASRNGFSRELWSVSLGGALELVHRFAGRVSLLDADRGRLLVAHARYRSETYGTVPGSAAPRSLTWLDWTNPGAISPDGRRFLFHEGGDGGGPRFSVFLQALPGSRPVRLGDGVALSLSADGRWALALLRDTLTLVAYPTGSGQAVPLPLGSLEAVHWAAFFPDGKKLLVLGNQPGRPRRLFSQDFPSGAPRPILPEGVVTRSRAISPDGTWVAALGRGGDRYALYPVAGGAPRDVEGLLAREEPLGFSEGGEALYVRRAGAGLPARVDRLDLATGQRTPWLEMSPEDTAGVGGVARILVTPDGRYHLYRVFRLLSDLFLVTLPG